MPENFNDNHPELLPGEVFLTNSDNESYLKIGRKTKRMGSVAYDVEGKPLSRRMFPVFVQRSELKGGS